MSMPACLVRVALFSLLTFGNFIWLIAQAQIDGAVSGTVMSAQGEVVAQADVTIRNNLTKAQIRVTTNSRGFYVVSELPEGTYTVSIGRQDFVPFTNEQIAVSHGRTVVVSPRLTPTATTDSHGQHALKASTETVEVSAIAPLVDSQRTNESALTVSNISPFESSPWVSNSVPNPWSSFDLSSRFGVSESVMLNHPARVRAMRLEDTSVVVAAPPAAGPHPTATIHVIVTDEWNRIVTGLDEENFRLLEGNVEQTIMKFNSVDEEIAMAAVINVAASTPVRQSSVHDAIVEFFKTANPRDEASLIREDASGVFLAAPINATNQEDVFPVRAPKKESKPGSLVQAIDVAINAVSGSKLPSRAFLVVTEADETAEPRTETALAANILRADIAVFGIVLPSASSQPRGLASNAVTPLLQYLCQVSGGQYFELGQLNETVDVATKIGIEIRNRYLLSYREPVSGHSSFLTVRVILEPPRGLPELRVFAPQIRPGPGPQ